MSIPTFKDNWPAPNEYLLELGRVTTLWGTLESSVNIAISKLAGYEAVLDYRAVIMVASSNFQQKIDIISALSEKLAPQYPNVKNYKSVIAKLQSAQKARNKYAHNAITTDQETGKVMLSYASSRGGSGVFQDSCHCLHTKPRDSLAALFPGSTSSAQQARSF